MSKAKTFMIAFKLNAMLSKNFGKTFREAENTAMKASQMMQQAGRAMSVAVTLPLAALGTAALRVGSDFESSLGTIQARTEKTADEMAKLESNFRNMARSNNYFAFTAREIASAYGEVAVAGQDVFHGTELMHNAAVFATATNNTLASSAYFLGNYLLKVGKDASYAERYINIFAAANQKTQIGLADLQKYLFNSNVTLQATNISGEEAAAMFGRLYQAGVRGARVYSGIENAMRSLLNPTQTQIDLLRELNIEREYENGQLRDGVPFLKDVANALSQLEGAQLSNAIATLGSTQMGADFLGGMIDIKGVLPDTIASLYEAGAAVDGTGTAFQMASTQHNNFAGGTAQLRASFEELMLQISQHLLPHISNLVGIVTGAVEWFGNLSEGTQRTIVLLGLVAAAAGPVLVVFGKVAGVVGRVQATFGKFRDTIKAVKGLQEAQNLATAANTKLTKINTAVTQTANKASAARKAATSAENKALKLAAQADILRATSGAKSAKAIAAAASAEKARTIAIKANKIANKQALALDKIRNHQTIVKTAATNANTKAQTANMLATSKLGKAMAFFAAKKAASAVAFKAFGASLKGMSLGMKVVAIAKGALTLATKALTIGFQVMSKAIMKIPVFGWIIAGIAGIGIVIHRLFRWFNRTSEEFRSLSASSKLHYEEVSRLNREYQRATVIYGENSEQVRLLSYELENARYVLEANRLTKEQFVAQNEKLLESHNRLVGSFMDSIAAINLEEQNTTTLINRLVELSTQYTLTAAEQEQMLTIMDSLNSQFPELSLVIDETTGSLNNSIYAIRELAEAQAEAGRMDAHRTAFVEALQQEADLYAQLQVAMAEYAAARQRQDEAKGLNRFNPFDWSYSSARDEADFFLEQLEYIQTAWDENQAIQANATQAFYDYAAAVEVASRAMISYEDAVNRAIDSVYYDLQALIAIYDEAFEAAHRSVQGQFNIWDKAAEVIPKSIDAVTEAMQSQIAHWQVYNDNLNTLTDRAGDFEGLSEMISTFADGSPQSIAMIAGLAYALESAAYDEIRTMISSWGKLQSEQDAVAHSIAELTTDFSNGIDKIESRMFDAISNMNMYDDAAAAARLTIQAYIDEIRSMAGAAHSAASEVAQATSNALRGGGTNIPVVTQWGSSTSSVYKVYGHAKGSEYTKDTFIAGEQGPELITGAAGRKVFTAIETGNIFNNLNSALSNNSSQALPDLSNFMRFDNLFGFDDEDNESNSPKKPPLVNSMQRIIDGGNNYSSKFELNYSPTINNYGQGGIDNQQLEEILKRDKDGLEDRLNAWYEAKIQRELRLINA